MGYTTSFNGGVRVAPPLNAAEIDYLRKFNETRRMSRLQGPYFVGGDGFKGQQPDSGIIDYNSPPKGQPSLWCQWEPTPDGASIIWDGGEKFYDAAEWMKYLITHFLQPMALAKNELWFLQANHVVNGVIEAQGEDPDDRWDLVVQDNEVFIRTYSQEPGNLEPV
jgi:hypothetical protein